MAASSGFPENGLQGSAWDHYIQVKEVGKGNFSNVFLAEAKNPQKFGVKEVAVKTCPKSDQKKVAVLRKEWTALSLASNSGHPGIICAFEYFEDDQECSMILEYCSNGTLMHWLDNNQDQITERTACKVIDQLVQAVEFIHESGYAHRDIKPHNILVYQTQPLTIRLADFGLVKKCAMHNDFWARQCSAGDMDIMSPNMMDSVHDGQPASAEEFRKNDIYAIGVCLYFLLSGHPPYPGNVDPRTQPDYPWLGSNSERFPNVSEDAIACCKWMMCPENDKRPEAGELMQDLWFQQMARTTSTGSNLSFAKTGDDIPAPAAPPPSEATSATNATLSGMGSPQNTGGSRKGVGTNSPTLARHQTELLETEWTVTPSNDNCFETANATNDRTQEQEQSAGAQEELTAE